VQTLNSGGTGNGAAQNPYAFHQGVKDVTGGLVHFGTRWYDPTTGTWTQQDTLDSPLDPANANLYAYAGDDPINDADASGNIDLSSVAEECAEGALVSLGIGLLDGTAETGIGALGDAVGGCAISGSIDVIKQEDEPVGEGLEVADDLDVVSELADAID
jgi:RHS repeat-associated protein